MKNIGENINLRNVLINLLYTVIICAAIAVLLAIEGPHLFVPNLIVSLSVGLPITSIVMLLIKLFKPKTIVSVLSIFLIGVVIGYPAGLLVGGFILKQFFSIVTKEHPLRVIISCIIFSTAVGWFFYSKARLRTSNRIIQEERIKRLSSEKETLEAKLRLLQAQIEPHFLFNTLSNVLSLIDTDPARGKSMLTDLILNFTIELPDDLRQYPFPPMLLQPLVENAIKHGLEPKIDGGTVTIKAMEKDGLIRIEVIDTGIGFSAYQKNGVGIGNVKERLQLLYGEKGRLTLEENKPSGVRAIIEAPEHDV